MDRVQASIWTVLWMVFADMPLILIPMFLYLRSRNFHLLLIPLPAGLVVNTLIYLSRRTTAQGA
jgi:hypothetical protein